MKPENTQSSAQGFEQLPVAPQPGVEAVPVLPRPEVGLEAGQQRTEQMAEAGAIAAGAAAPAYTAVPVTPVVPPQDDASQAGAQATGIPLTAADEDLIEREWVDKAKLILQQTKEDPHARTEQVNELQRGYLQKRFGRTIGTGQ